MAAAAAAMATTANTALAKSDGIAAARSLENIDSSTTFLPRTTSTSNSPLHTTPPHSTEERMSSSLNTTPTSSLHSLPDTSSCSSTACSPAVAFNNSSSSSEILAQEKEKVLGVTILTQLQELDLAIKLREQNKVDGRKTRWIEHRKKQEELVKKSPDGGSSNSVSTRRKNRSSGGSRARHKKENRELSTTTPPTSADDASPTKTEEFASLPGSPTNTDNNNTPVKLLLNPSNVTIPVVTTMKMEVTEPLVGCVEPTNVLETMKQQFLLDTTKEDHLDSAKLTNGILEDSNSTSKRPIAESKKKNKSKPIADLSTKNSLKKGPGVKPPKRKLKRITQAVSQKQGKKAKEIKTKKQIAAAVVATALKKIPSGGPLPKDISISNFFTKQKTRGLREVRKPEGEDDDAAPEDYCTTASAAQSDEISKTAAAAPLLLPTAGQPLRCPLIAATAKIVTSKGNAKKKLLGKSNVKLTAAEKKTLRSVLNGGVRQVTLSSNYKKKQAKLRDALGEKSLGVADSPQSLPEANSKQQSSALDSDSDSPDFISKRGGKGRGFKRKLQRDVSLASPPKKCTKKTSTVVAEVHNTMNGEPQSSVPANKAPSATRKKKQGLAVDVVTSPPKSVTKAASAADVDTVNNTDNVTAYSSPATANVMRDDLRTGDFTAKANGDTQVKKDAVNSSLCNGDSHQSINGSPSSISSLDTVAVSSNKTPAKSGLTITRSSSSSLHSKTSPVIKRFSSSGDSASKIAIDSLLLTGDESSTTPTLSDTLPRSQSLPNGNNTRLVRKVSSPSKSSDLMLKSDPVVPEQPSLRKRNVTSPVKLIRPSSLKSKETPSKDVAIITENSSPNYKEKQTSNGDISNLSNDILPMVADNLTENIELLISPTRKTETQVTLPGDDVKQNGLSRRSIKAQSMLIPEEPKQSSPKRKSTTEIQSERSLPLPIVPDEVPAEIRTKSPTGSDCDNNNSSVLPVDDKHEPDKTSVSNSAGNESTNQQTILSETNDSANEQPQEKSSKLKSGAGDSEKRSGKMPRYLKQLFTDEGVQNMLKSIEGDSNMVGADGVTPITSDAMLHKLRPKRPPEHSMAISPEPDVDIAFFSSTASGKRRKKYNEVDCLLMDEGLLNLLTSREGSSRRGTPSREESQLEANTRKSDASTAASDSNNQGKACSVEPVPTLLSTNGEVTEVASSTDGKTVSDSNEVVINKETAHKRRPGRPQKVRQQNQSKSTSPTVTPDIEVLEQYDSVSKKNKTGAVDDTSSAIVANHTSPAAVTASLDSSNVRPDGVGKNSSNSLLPNAPHDTSTSADARVSAATTTTTTAKTVSGTAVACGGASGARAPSNAAIERQQQLTPQAPVKMRRMDLPTSPTMASLDSLVRSLEENSGHQHSGGGGSSAVPTSSVAFMQHRVPGPAMPTLRGMRGLVMDNLAAGAGGGGGGLRQSQRSSVRHNAELSATVNYRDIVLRKMNNFVHIIMAPQTTKIKNSLNSRVLRELCDALSTLRGDPSVRLVLLTSNGASWCQGVDLTSLHHHNPDTRHNHAHNLARAIKEFLKMLVQFPKPIIAGVNGNAMGLGVTMLPLFDMVFASDNAEFYLPYSKLGQVPEGGATYTFPTLLGKLQSTRLFMGHKFSAAEGMQLGLVSEVLWPANFQETLLPKVALLATQSAQSMEATKALMNHHLLTKLELSVESECHTLLSQWTSTTFDVLSRRFLDTHAPLMQKPVVVPL